MAVYSVYYYCSECGYEHPLGISVILSDGPKAKASLSEVYDGRELPADIATVVGLRTSCLSNGKLTSQEDLDRLYLVPLEKARGLL